MKPSEIRIGNLIHYNSNNTTVTEIRTNELPELGYYGSVSVKVFLTDTHYTYESPWLAKCSPIPITEEWLLKSGFEKRDGNVFKNNSMPYWAKDAIVLLFNESPPENTYLIGIGFNVGSDYYVATARWIHTVHELQNFYKEAKGQDLTIKP